jgi:hypothetical protein
MVVQCSGENLCAFTHTQFHIYVENIEHHHAPLEITKSYSVFQTQKH